MNILILSFYYEPDICAGSFRTKSLVTRLSKKISDLDTITIITTMPNRYSTYRTSDVQKFEEVNNIKIKRINIPHHTNGIRDQVRSFYVYFKKVLNFAKDNNADLVFATSSRLFTAFLGAIVSKRLKKPLYLDIRDIFVDTIQSISKVKYIFLKPLLCIVENYTFNAPIKVNLVSKGFKSYFQTKFPKLEYSYFSNGIDNEFLENDFDDSDINKKKKHKILYAGNIGQGQGLHHILPEFANQVKEQFEIEIIGDGGALGLLKQKVKKAMVENLTIHPPVSRQILINKYQEADVLFLHLNDVPAFKKVLPSKLFEYAATGKPIIAGVSGFCKYFIEKEIDNAIVFNPGNDLEALKALNAVKLEIINRNFFNKKYKRETIMDSLSSDILNCI